MKEKTGHEVVESLISVVEQLSTIAEKFNISIPSMPESETEKPDLKTAA